MQSQSDWCSAVPFVLFAIRTAQHASTGFTPFCMLYNYDPILPFEYTDKLKNGILSDGDANCESDGDNGLDVSGGTISDPVLSKIKEMENNHKTIFTKASKLKKKAQKHQAKCYNNSKTRVNLWKLVTYA